METLMLLSLGMQIVAQFGGCFDEMLPYMEQVGRCTLKVFKRHVGRKRGVYDADDDGDDDDEGASLYTRKRFSPSPSPSQLSLCASVHNPC